MSRDGIPRSPIVWTINSNTINEARMGYTYQGNFWEDLEKDHGYAAALGWQYAKADQIPAIQFYKDYPYAWIEPEVNSFYKENVFDPSDVVTMIKGRHVIHFGGEVLIYREKLHPVRKQFECRHFGFNGDYTAQWTVDPATGVASSQSSTGARLRRLPAWLCQ